MGQAGRKRPRQDASGRTRPHSTGRTPRPSAASPRNTRAKPVRRDAVPQHEARVRNGRARPRPDGGTGTAAHATRPGAPGPEASPGRCVLSVSVNTGNRWRGRDLLCATLNHRAGIKRSGRRHDRRTPGRQVPTSKGQQAPGLATRVNRALGPAASSREMRGRARLHLACVVAARDQEAGRGRERAVRGHAPSSVQAVTPASPQGRATDRCKEASPPEGGTAVF